MRLSPVIAVLGLSLTIMACTKDPSSPGAAASTPKVIDPSPRVVPVVDIPQIARQPQAVVTSLLGAPSLCEQIKQGLKCSFNPGETEVVFINGVADWITVNALPNASFDAKALTYLGFDQQTPDFSNGQVMRWKHLSGFLEINVFPAGSAVHFVYVKTQTP